MIFKKYFFKDIHKSLEADYTLFQGVYRLFKRWLIISLDFFYTRKESRRQSSIIVISILKNALKLDPIC